MKKVLVLIIVAVLLVSSSALAASPFPDFTDENHWAYDAVTVLYAAGLLRGYPDGTLKIRQDMTRAEAFRLVADTFLYLNDKIDVLKGQDTTFGDDEETAKYLRTVVQEALTEKLGYQVDKATIDELIISIAEMKERFEEEKASTDLKFLDIDEKMASLASELNEYSQEVAALEASYKADLEKIKQEYIAELNKIKTDMAGLEATVVEIKVEREADHAALDSIKSDVTAAMSEIDDINKRLDKVQFSGSSEVIARKVDMVGVLPSDGVFAEFSTAETFRHELSLNMGIRPSDDVFINIATKLVNDFSGDDPALPFAVGSLNMTVDAPDFQGVYGDVGAVTLSDLVLKNYRAQGVKLTGKTGVLDGAKLYLLEDKGHTGKYVALASGNWKVSDTASVGAAFAQVFNHLTRTMEDKVLMAFGETKILDDAWTLRGEAIARSSGGSSTPGLDAIASRLSAAGTLGPVNVSLSHTQIGPGYSVMNLQGNEASATADTSVFRGDLSFPVSQISGLTARAGVEIAQSTPLVKVGVNYKSNLFDMNGTFEVDLERESKDNTGRNLGYVKAVWNELVQNSVFQVAYAVKPAAGMTTTTETSVAFDWDFMRNAKLGLGYILEPAKATSKIGVNYTFTLGSFNAGLGLDLRSIKLPADTNASRDTAVDFSLQRSIGERTNFVVSWKTLSRVAANGTTTSANVAGASVKVDF
jgi:hypothetical protein